MDIGIVGVSLLVFLYLICLFVEPKNSISVHYTTKGRNVFVGALFVQPFFYLFIEGEGLGD
jgi:hypothetical protein